MGEVVGISSGSPPTTSKHWSATGEIPAETRDRERNKRKGAECRERLPELDTRIPPTEAERAAVEELREITESEGMRRVAYARNACENLERELRGNMDNHKWLNTQYVGKEKRRYPTP
jgi:hypothetical protein